MSGVLFKSGSHIIQFTKSLLIPGTGTGVGAGAGTSVAPQQNLLKELSCVRQEVYQEHQWFQAIEQIYFNKEACAEVKRKRLLFLFVKDLSNGLCGGVLSNKEQRDSLNVSMKMSGVSMETKALGWLVVGCLNFGMLFYVYLFAMTQTQSRQSAWFQSFVMWLLFDMFIACTGVVLVTHLFIPLYVMSDIRTIKKKMLADIMRFRENQRNQKRRKLRREEREERRRERRKERGGRMMIEEFDSPLNDSLSREDGKDTEKEKEKEQEKENEAEAEEEAEEEEEEKEWIFNAAKYLYPSWRIASLFPELPESEMILQFTSPWPKKSFNREKKKVTKVYERKYFFLVQALSRVFVFFLTTLIHLPVVIQDLLIHWFSNSGFGYLVLLMIDLSHVHPLLPFAPLVFVVVVTHFLIFSRSKIIKGTLENQSSLRSIGGTNETQRDLMKTSSSHRHHLSLDPTAPAAPAPAPAAPTAPAPAASGGAGGGSPSSLFIAPSSPHLLLLSDHDIESPQHCDPPTQDASPAAFLAHGRSLSRKLSRKLQHDLERRRLDLELGWIEESDDRGAKDGLSPIEFYDSEIQSQLQPQGSDSNAEDNDVLYSLESQEEEDGEEDGEEHNQWDDDDDLSMEEVRDVEGEE